MKIIVAAEILTFGLVLWAHQLLTIGGRVPMVYVAMWFGSTTIVALIFSMRGFSPRFSETQHQDTTLERLWRYKMRMAAICLLPLTLVPLLEIRGVGKDPTVWLLDCALYISICGAPYFTLVGRSVVGGVALSMAAFQVVWTCGASVFFVIMEHAAKAKGQQLAQRAAFEEFFRPEYRYLFYILCTVMLLGYCPALLWLGHRRFLLQSESVSTR
jgi:hypothetical protein